MSLVSEREGSTCPDPALLDRLPSLVQIHSGRPPNHERNIFTVALFPLFSIKSIKLGVMAPFMFGRGLRGVSRQLHWAGGVARPYVNVPNGRTKGEGGGTENIHQTASLPSYSVCNQ